MLQSATLKLAGLIVFCCHFGASSLTQAAEYRAEGVSTLGTKTPERVLFVGNSYLYYNDSLHNHLKRIIAELQPELADSLVFKSATIGGARLQHHNIDWLLEPGRIGVKDGFEVVILQGGSAEALSDEAREDFLSTTSEYADKVRGAGAEPVLYMTHAYVPPHKRVAHGQIDLIASTYIAAGKAANTMVIPVGLAFDAAYRQRPDFSLHQLFDGSHPNMRGTYLAACVVYLSLYEGTLDGLSYDYFGKLSSDEINYLQSVATQITDRFFGRALN